ncbi:membrane-associated, eicosanoid/glutathione metabolism protein [Blastocladiella britannica]|nr:membrane-associated, eicosanoid/glutathione metabolism protein [Blastocladiella britannica]
MSNNNINLPITAVAGSVLGLYGVGLTFRVIAMRVKNKVSLGDGTMQFIMNYLRVQKEQPNDKAALAAASDIFGSKYFKLNSYIRAHGNFIENTPWIVVLSALVELTGALSPAVHRAIMSAFVVGRVAHVELGVLRPTGLGLGRTAGALAATGTAVAFCGAMLWQQWNNRA